LSIEYRQATECDIEIISKLAFLLYPNHNYDDLLCEMKSSITNKSEAFFLAYDKDLAVGFTQCSLRYDYVEGTGGGIVGYLEGISFYPSIGRKALLKISSGFVKTGH